MDQYTDTSRFVQRYCTSCLLMQGACMSSQIEFLVFDSPLASAFRSYCSPKGHDRRHNQNLTSDLYLPLLMHILMDHPPLVYAQRLDWVRRKHQNSVSVYIHSVTIQAAFYMYIRVSGHTRTKTYSGGACVYYGGAPPEYKQPR
jgi:hypothetical protein